MSTFAHAHVAGEQPQEARRAIPLEYGHAEASPRWLRRIGGFFRANIDGAMRFLGMVVVWLRVIRWLLPTLGLACLAGGLGLTLLGQGAGPQWMAAGGALIGIWIGRSWRPGKRRRN